MLHTDLIAPVDELLDRHAAARGANVAFSDARRQATWMQLRERTGAFADLGLAAGDRIAILLPNGVDWAEACLATLRAGCVAVPISFEASEPEVLYRLVDADCRMMVTTAARAAQVEALRPQTPALDIVVTSGADPIEAGHRFEDLAAGGANPPPRDPDDLMAPAFIISTSGRTGNSMCSPTAPIGWPRSGRCGGAS